MTDLSCNHAVYFLSDDAGAFARRAGIHVTERYVTAWEATCRALRGDMTAKSIPGMATGFGEACSALRAGTTATPAPDFVTRLYEARDSMRERLFAAGCAGIQAATALASCAVGPAQSHDPAAPAKQFSEALPIARRMGAASLSLVEHAYGDVWPEYIDTETVSVMLLCTTAKSICR